MGRHNLLRDSRCDGSALLHRTLCDEFALIQYYIVCIVGRVRPSQPAQATKGIVWEIELKKIDRSSARWIREAVEEMRDLSYGKHIHIIIVKASLIRGS